MKVEIDYRQNYKQRQGENLWINKEYFVVWWIVRYKIRIAIIERSQIIFVESLNNLIDMCTFKSEIVQNAELKIYKTFWDPLCALRYNGHNITTNEQVHYFFNDSKLK